MRILLSLARQLPTTFVLNAATLGPIGKLKAPGTMGSLIGLVPATILFPMPAIMQLLILAAATVFAIVICNEAEVRLSKRDPSEVILDEFIAMPICLLGLAPLIPPGWNWLVFLIAFGLFRLFDILKPFAIKDLQKLPGGYGVVIDDVAAAGATWLILYVSLLFL